MVSPTGASRSRATLIRLSYLGCAASPTPAADTGVMARVLISEPHADCRALVELVVQRIGHDPLGPGELAEGDDPGLLILEPAAADGLAIAHQLRRRLENLPIICTSVRPPSAVTEKLQPAAYLVKPFRLADLESAVANALA